LGGGGGGAKSKNERKSECSAQAAAQSSGAGTRRIVINFLEKKPHQPAPRLLSYTRCGEGGLIRVGFGWDWGWVRAGPGSGPGSGFGLGLGLGLGEIQAGAGLGTRRVLVRAPSGGRATGARRIAFLRPSPGTGRTTFPKCRSRIWMRFLDVVAVVAKPHDPSRSEGKTAFKRPIPLFFSERFKFPSTATTATTSRKKKKKKTPTRGALG
jgi:hypothetical protein